MRMLNFTMAGLPAAAEAIASDESNPSELAINVVKRDL
jgi:hypothetical protein